MESYAQLDVIGRSAFRRLVLHLLALAFVPILAFSQQVSQVSGDLAEIKQMYDAGRWADVVQAVPNSDNDNADLQMYRGLALAKLGRWDEAGQTFAAGARRHPEDSRFSVELGGVDYHLRKFRSAEEDLRRALAIRPEDDYANNFLASIYFLDGNLEAALKYWNRTGHPELADLTFDPQPKLKPLILDRALKFSPGAVWRRDAYLTTRARLEALGLYPSLAFQLQARPDGAFDLKIQAPEKNSWGSSNLRGAISLLRGLPYETIYPEFYNLRESGMNWRSLFRWDKQKRRLYSELQSPLFGNPSIRYRVYFDGRNENWNLTNTLAPFSPVPSFVNLEKESAGAEIRFLPSGRWQWNLGLEYSHRNFRNLVAIPAGATPFFANGSLLALRSNFQHSLIRIPERRFTLESVASGEIGTFFQSPLGRYGRVQGALGAHWYPRARGDDYEIQAGLGAGKTFGLVPFDKLFMLGFERDNDLFLRGHPGLLNGQKGRAPLGRDFVLANSEIDKIVVRNDFLELRLGPLLDTGRTYDSSGYFGARDWLWDTGAQAKIRLLGSIEFVLGYGKDLRTGTNSFFSKVVRWN